jgi:hypothetical protein
VPGKGVIMAVTMAPGVRGNRTDKRATMSVPRSELPTTPLMPITRGMDLVHTGPPANAAPRLAGRSLPQELHSRRSCCD